MEEDEQRVDNERYRLIATVMLSCPFRDSSNYRAVRGLIALLRELTAQS